MPELPEVESIIKGLRSTIINQKIKNIEVLNPKTVYSKSNKRKIDPVRVKEFKNRLKNQRILNITRNSKQIIITCEDYCILIHLKMTGQLVFQNQIEKLDKHCCVLIELDEGFLMYNDVRKFGYVLEFSKDQIKQNLDEFGIDPAKDELDLNYIFNKFQQSSKNLKSVFLDQKIICGIGNIYSDEISFDARIDPRSIVSKLKKTQVKKLLLSIDRIIKTSINMGGSSVSDYRLADGSKGEYAKMHKVYGRKTKPCLECNKQLNQYVVQGRTTIVCTYCQKLLE